MTASPTKVSVTIIAHNEAANIARAIESVRWADEVIVVDSESTDQTRALAMALGARVIVQPWLGYGAQKNFAHRLATSEWVLNLDADEAVSEELAAEIQSFLRSPRSHQAAGVAMPRKTFYWNRWIMHGGWYPNVLTRFSRKTLSTWTEPNVHEKLLVQGPVVQLSAPLLHYSFRSIEDQVTRNIRYAREGSAALLASGKNPHIGHLLLKPVGKFLECYLLKRGFLDGLAGFVIAINASHSMFLKYAFALERKKGNEDKP